MILRLQTEEELAALQQKLKAKLPSRIHLNELRNDTGTDPEKGGNHVAGPERSSGQLPGSHAVTGVASVKTRTQTRQKRLQATFEHKLLSRQLTQAQIPFQEEFRFEPKRRWKADFLVDNFLVEIVGGLWMKRGGHSQGQAQLDDMEKFNHAAKLGYRMLQFSPDQVKSGEAIGFIEQLCKG